MRCRISLSRITPSHIISRPSPHSRSTSRRMDAVCPGQRVLTASFAARKSRVQIPPAPLNALVRAIVGCLGRKGLEGLSWEP